MAPAIEKRDKIPATHALWLMNGCRKNGVDPAEILGEIGIDPAILRNPTREFPLCRIGDLVKAVTYALQDETLGFLKQKTPPGSVEMAIHAIVGSATMHDAVTRWIKFWDIVNPEISLALVIQGEEAHHLQTKTFTNPHKAKQAAAMITWTSLLFTRLFSWLIDKPIMLERLCFAFPQPSDAGNIEEIFPTTIYFGQPQTRLVFNRRYLEMPVVRTAQEIPSFIQILPELMTIKRVDESITGRVNRIIRTSERLDSLSFDAVADTLNMPPNVLRRRLKNEHSTFNAIKESARKDLALYHLQGDTLKINEVAYMLGFSEPSAFNRAFKKWTGHTPGEFRKSAP